MTVCKEGHDAVTTREDSYGTMGSSWQAIGRRAEGLIAPGDSPGEKAVKVLIAMKLERLKNSPNDRDHYRDLCGYLEVLWQTRLETLKGDAETAEIGFCIKCGFNAEETTPGEFYCYNCSRSCS